MQMCRFGDRHLRPDSVLGVAVLVHDLAALARDELADVLKLGAAGAVLNSDNLSRDLILEHTGGVVEGAAC